MKRPKPTHPATPSTFSDAIVNRNRVSVRTIGGPRWFSTDIYHALVGMSWPRFFATFAAVFFAINSLFALLYLINPAELEGGHADELPAFARAFFFSVHTLATVGYGNVVPRSLLGNLFVTVEIACGLLLIAVTSGLMFARFSRPTARILFSRIAIVTPFEGAPHLMFRVANQRNNFILEASARLSVIRQEAANGHILRRFHDLKLVRDRNPVFSLSWLVMHRIDETSPLYGLNAESAAAGEVELVVILSGFDATMSQQIYTRHAWHSSAIRWGHSFVDVLRVAPDGGRILDYSTFHDTEPDSAP